MTVPQNSLVTMKVMDDDREGCTRVEAFKKWVRNYAPDPNKL
jgi:hypothetical protein